MWSLLVELVAEEVEAFLLLEKVGAGRACRVLFGALRGKTKLFGLSLGDRARVALAQRMDCPAVTADRAWVEVDTLGVEIVLFHGEY